jgi:hypothetical protein
MAPHFSHKKWGAVFCSQRARGDFGMGHEAENGAALP